MMVPSPFPPADYARMTDSELAGEQRAIERARRRHPRSAHLADDMLRLIRFQLGGRRIVLAGCGPGGQMVVLRDPKEG